MTGLQALFQRNMSEIAKWFYDSIFATGKEKYLAGIVVASETHYSALPSGLFDYSDVMLNGFRDHVASAFGCDNCSFCLTDINGAFGTSFSSVQEIEPPNYSCGSQNDDYCGMWNDYRNMILKVHLERTAQIFVDAGVPAEYLFGHDVPASGGFLDGPVLMPIRNPGLTAYGWSEIKFREYADCVPGAPDCLEWAITEASLNTNSCDDLQMGPFR